MTALRFGLRLFCDWLGKRGNHAIGKKKILIFGAGEMGFLAYQFLMTQKKTAYEIVGFLDDDPTKRYKTLCGKKVLGNYFNIESLVKLYKVDEVFFAVTNIASHKMMKIIQACQEAKIQYRFLSTLHDSTIPNSFNSSFVETNMADLFKTQHIEIDRRSIRRLLEGRECSSQERVEL
jgi:undecaprenyl-phosphate galactose phosphotransferase